MYIMKKTRSLIIGFILLGLILVLSLVKADMNIALRYSGYAGLALLLLAALFSGAFIAPDSRRVDITNENSESLNRRIKFSTAFLLMALPNLIACLSIYLLNLI